MEGSTTKCYTLTTNVSWMKKNNYRKSRTLVICFVIWRERCRRIFQEVSKTDALLAVEIAQETQSWFGITQRDSSLSSILRLKGCMLAYPTCFVSFSFFHHLLYFYFHFCNFDTAGVDIINRIWGLDSHISS